MIVYYREIYILVGRERESNKVLSHNAMAEIANTNCVTVLYM